MGLFIIDYQYLTRKQANIIYSNIKRGNVTASKKFTKRLYDSVERRPTEHEEVAELYQYFDILEALFDNRYDVAQAGIDGKEIASYSKKIGEELAEVTNSFKQRVYARHGNEREMTKDIIEKDGKLYEPKSILEKAWKINGVPVD